MNPSAKKLVEILDQEFSSARNTSPGNRGLYSKRAYVYGPVTTVVTLRSVKNLNTKAESARLGRIRKACKKAGLVATASATCRNSPACSPAWA